MDGDFARRERWDARRTIRPSHAETALVEYRHEHRPHSIEHPSGDQLVTRCGEGLLQTEQVPTAGLSKSIEPCLRQQQSAGEPTSRRLAHRRRKIGDGQSQLFDHATGGPLAQFMGDGPVLSLEACFAAEINDRLTTGADADKSPAMRHPAIGRYHDPQPLGNQRRIHGRPFYPGLRKQLCSDLIEDLAELFVRNFAGHSEAPRRWIFVQINQGPGRCKLFGGRLWAEGCGCSANPTE